jgi:hypothetical protein
MYNKAYLRYKVSWRGLAVALALSLIFALAFGMAASLKGQAATGAGYIFQNGQLSAGGGVASGGGYRLSGAAAGSEAGKQAGGNYQMQGGLWLETTYGMYLPLVIRR